MTKMYFQYLMKKLKCNSREPSVVHGFANLATIPILKI